MERSAWAWMPIAALLLSWAEPAPCSAQPPAVSPSTSPPSATPFTIPVARQVPSPVPPPTPPPRPWPSPWGAAAPATCRPPCRCPPRPRAGGGSATTGPSPFQVKVGLKPAPLEPTDLRFPINLATALQLSDARPLVVAAAQASVWVAEAELTRTKVLWVPTLNIGFDYIRHDGGGPDFNKGIMTAPSVNFFYGGAGLWGVLPTTDAIYLPLATRQVLNSAHWGIQTAKNDALLQTADAYFRVHQYRGMYAGALYCVARGHDLVERIAQLSKELVPRVEVERARNMLADLEQQAVSARQEWRVQSANLTQVLRLDPRAVVVPLEHDHAQVTLIDPARPLDDLMPIALTNRPEIAANQALVQAAEVGIRMEKARPLLPNILLNGFQTPYEMIQAGIFGLGPNSSLNQWRGRFDFSIQPLWQLENMGIGNLARIKAARGIESMAVVEFFKRQDMVAADVTRALRGSSRRRPGSSRPTAPCAPASSPSTATSRAWAKPTVWATSWSWSTGRRKPSTHSSS